MAKIRRIRLKTKKYIPVLGTSPGSIQLYEDALKPQITVYSYNSDEFYSEKINGLDELEIEIDKHKEHYKWIEIKGIGDVRLLTLLEKKFNINKLVIEDIADCRQRPKLDEYEDYLFEDLLSNIESLIKKNY